MSKPKEILLKLMKQITFSMFVDDYFFYNIEIDYNDIKKLSFLFVTEYNCHPVYVTLELFSLPLIEPTTLVKFVK